VKNNFKNMKKILTIISLLAVCTFFACKKEETNVVAGKNLEVSGMVFDFETQNPLEGVDILRTRSFNSIQEYLQSTEQSVKSATTAADGKYKFKFFAKDSVTYWLGPTKKDYIVFDGLYTCSGCIRNITPLNYGGFNTSYNLTDTFYMAKAGKLNLNFSLGKTPINDTLFLKNYQIYKNKKTVHDYPIPYNYENNTSPSRVIETLADRMTYLTWKLKSETTWHQDSILTPFQKAVDFTIKY
jgi:hypothetical protein